jgi:hypothetical protein
MKIQLVRVEAMWRIAVLLTNAILCARGSNHISTYFDLPPPTLEENLDTTMDAYYDNVNHLLYVYI